MLPTGAKMVKATFLLVYLIIVGILEVHSNPASPREDSDKQGQGGVPPPGQGTGPGQTQNPSGGAAGVVTSPKANPTEGGTPQNSGNDPENGVPKPAAANPTEKDAKANGHGGGTVKVNPQHQPAHDQTPGGGNSQAPITVKGQTDGQTSKEQKDGTANNNQQPNPTADSGKGPVGDGNTNPKPPTPGGEGHGGSPKPSSETADDKKEGKQAAGVDGGNKAAGDGGNPSGRTEDQNKPKENTGTPSDASKTGDANKQEGKDGKAPVTVTYHQTKSASPKGTSTAQTPEQAPLMQVIQDQCRVLIDLLRTGSIRLLRGTKQVPRVRLIIGAANIAKEEGRMGELLDHDITTMVEGYFQPKIKVRLVNKAWKPLAHLRKVDRVMDFYEWDAADAQDAFEASNNYLHEERLLANAIDLLRTNLYNKDNPSIVIIDTVDAEKEMKFLSNTITALAMRNLHQAYNIFAIDLSELTYYMQSISFLFYMKVKKVNYFPLGKAIGDFFVAGINSEHMSPEKLHFVGFGFSARLVIYINMHILDVHKKKIGSLLALNPLGSPGNPSAGPVSQRNAQVVHVYHTNSFPIGTMARVGTADFTFNDGIVQPECKESKNPWKCSHKAVLERFWYVILYGAKDFKARQCFKYFNFYVGDCDTRESATLTYPIVNTDVKGRFYLRTSGEAPYGLGEEGSMAVPGTKEEFMEAVERAKGTDEAALQDIETYKMLML